MKKLKIENMAIDDLITYKNNTKRHTPEQIEQIKQSILDFGMNDPIAVWRDNTIIEGHGRLQALKELGITVVPVIRLDDLTDDQRKAYTIVHNKLTLNSDFDIEILNEELSHITDIDMKKYGLEITDIPTEDFYSDIFVDAPEKEKEEITCPFCGRTFEAD